MASSSASDKPLAIVTGANSGFGYGLTAILLRKGFEVVVGSRSVPAGEEAVKSMNITAKDGGKAVVLQLDLADLVSVVAFATAFQQQFPARKLSYLVLNAGIVKLVKEVSKQGFEETLAVNHFGGVALFNLLLASHLIPSRARVVPVGSMVHQQSGLTDKTYSSYDLTGVSSEAFSAGGRYCDSKLLNTLWGLGVHRRFNAKHGVSCNSGHPGSGLFTGLGRRDASTAMRVAIVPLLGLLAPFLWVFGFAQTWHEGGLAELACCEHSQSGLYFYRTSIAAPSAAASDERIQDWLWDETRRLLLEAALKHGLPVEIAGPAEI